MQRNGRQRHKRQGQSIDYERQLGAGGSVSVARPATWHRYPFNSGISYRDFGLMGFPQCRCRRAIMARTRGARGATFEHLLLERSEGR